MSVETDIDGLDAILSRIERLEGRTRDIRPLAEVLHDWLVGRMETAFETQGQSQGSKWAGYQQEPRYRAYKRKRASALNVLRWISDDSTERLYPSLTQKTHPDHVWKVQKSRILFGTRTPWARRIESGGENFFGESAPPRPFVRLGDQERASLALFVAKWVMETPR